MERWYRWPVLVAVGVLLLFSTGSALARTNLMLDEGVESDMPFFWYHNATGGSLVWATDDSHNGDRSLKIMKTGTGTAASWMTGNQANTYWNSMVSALYTFSFWAKTSGVNTNPTTDAAKIYAVWHFLDGSGNPIIDDVMVEVDQSAATTDWTEYSTEIALPSDPVTATCEVMMGASAMGTVWFDQFNLTSDPWHAGFFGDDLETPRGWMHWTDGTNGLAAVSSEQAHTGSYSIKLMETDDGSDEMVFYSIPYPAYPNTDYLVGCWVNIADIDSNTAYFPTAPVGDNIGDRANLCFFFHQGDIYNGWDPVGGDQFIYLNQTHPTSDGWVMYWGIATSPEGTTGLSMRARFNSAVMGTVYFDDFFAYGLATGDNIVVDDDLEGTLPFFWSKDDLGGSLNWASDFAHNGTRSLKIGKSATTNAASWKTDNQATTYWNDMTEALYTFSFWAKTQDVNTNPTTDAEKIGVKWEFKDGSGADIIDPVFVAVDQTSAMSDWTEYSTEIALPSAPATATCWAMMGQSALGTVWFDQFLLNSDPWHAGFFGDDLETPTAWMHWTDGTNGFASTVDVGTDAHSGTHVTKLIETDDGSDELVFYSIPFATQANTYYEFSVWVKTVSISPLDTLNYYPSAVITDGIADRASLCFFYHTGDIETSWDPTGGDQFVYIQQREASQDWTLYRGVLMAPENSTGASIRARFNSTVMGEVWYDDFMIRSLSFLQVGVDDPPGGGVEAALPTSIVLEQNYPNPFNATTNIVYTLPARSEVTLSIYDLLGREVALLVHETQAGGRHLVTYDGSALSSGLYFYRVSTPQQTAVRKMIYLK